VRHNEDAELSAGRPAARSSPPPLPPTPELDKLVQAQELIATIGGFLDWYTESGGRLARHGQWIDGNTRRLHDGFLIDFRSREALVAEYIGVDLVAANLEKEALLEHVRQRWDARRRARS